MKQFKTTCSAPRICGRVSRWEEELLRRTMMREKRAKMIVWMEKQYPEVTTFLSRWEAYTGEQIEPEITFKGRNIYP